MSMIIDPMSTFVMSDVILDKLTLHAESSLPHESCALLIGPIPPSGSKQVQVSEVILTSNISSRPAVQFEINPQDLLKAYDHADVLNQAIVGIFHSHPAPPYPSSTDIDNMKINPCVWLIMGGSDKEIKSYQYRDGYIYKVALEITK
jgi:proteasome lid subunit RPN8/RPN11